MSKYIQMRRFDEERGVWIYVIAECVSGDEQRIVIRPEMVAEQEFTTSDAGDAWAKQMLEERPWSKH